MTELSSFFFVTGPATTAAVRVGDECRETGLPILSGPMRPQPAPQQAPEPPPPPPAPVPGLLARVEEYRDVLRSQGRSKAHIETVYRHCCHILNHCGAKGLTKSGIQTAIGLKIRAEGRSLRTAQHYLTSIRAFCRWAAEEDQGYLERDPTRSIKTFKAAKDPRHSRRALTDEELHRLLAAAASSEWVDYGLTGRDWAERWHVMVATMLREGTVRQLTVEQFRLSGPAPHVHVYGWQEAKRGKDRAVPILGDSAERIAAYLASKTPAALAFPLPDRYAVLKVFRKHLLAARIDQGREVTGQDGVQRRQDVVDVHALRTTGITRLARANVPVKIAQEIAGHSSPLLTMNTYSKVTHSEISRAIQHLPPLNATPPTLKAPEAG